MYTKPVFFTKIVDHDGKVLIENVPERHQALKPQTAFLADRRPEGSRIRRSKVCIWIKVSPTGGAGQVPGMTTAGKSGTTTASKDLWFTGFTPYYTAGIWSGNDASQPISGGSSYHKDIWKKIMERVHEGLPIRGFPYRTA